METFPITTIPPEFGYRKIHSWPSVRNVFKKGYEERRSLYSKVKRKIVAHFAVTAAEKNTIQTFIDARKGPVEAFYLHMPDTDTDLICIVNEPEEGIAYTWKLDDLWEFDLEFIEVF